MAAPVMLIIRDGWGINPGGPEKRESNGDTTLLASTPFHDQLYGDYPWSQLSASGMDVGLPEGQMGNSEVGHLNLGAGRIVYQELTRINVAIRNGEFQKNKIILESINYAKNNSKPLHLLGLVSNGGVHSHINHLKALLDVCKENGLKNVFVHAFTDGRDCDPKSGIHFIQELEDHMKKSTGMIASIEGRYYAMDRDNRW